MDLLTALWPYLMGALIGWMASWGLAHRFKYATDSTKTIRVEKVVEKVVEVDRQELVDRLAEAEALLRDYQRQGKVPHRRPPAKQPGEIGREELIEKLTELESTVTDYGAGGGGSRPAAPVKPAAATSRAHSATRSPGPEGEPRNADAELVALRSAPASATEIEKLSPPEPSRPEKAREQTGKGNQSGAAGREPAGAPRAADTSQLALPVERPNGSAAASAVQAEPTAPSKKGSGKAAAAKTPADTAAAPASVTADRHARAPATAQKKRRRKAASTPPPAETAAAPTRDTSEQGAPTPATGGHNGERIEIDWAGARAAGFAFKDPGERTDFTYIEGIGPKISTLLLDAGIESYHHLASTSGADLREILDGAGPRYRLADPTSWPQQAAMIAGSRWQALHDWKQQQRQEKSTASEPS